MRPNLPVPRLWSRRVRSSVLQILALSHYTFTALVARAANDRDRRTRRRAEIDRLSHELAMLQEGRIKISSIEPSVFRRFNLNSGEQILEYGAELDSKYVAQQEKET